MLYATLWISTASATPVIVQTHNHSPPTSDFTPLFRDAPRKNPAAFRALGLDRLWRIPQTTETDRQQLLGIPEVQFVRIDGIGTTSSTTPNDPLLQYQWGLQNNGSWGGTLGADIDAQEAWSISTGRDILVAVLDSGINLLEPDLSPQLYFNPGEFDDNTDSDDNGFVDDITGWDFADHDSDTTDVGGHGSNVAGILAGRGNNEVAFTGVCWDCKILPVRVLGDDGWGYTSWWAQGIVYAVDNGAQVINMSLVSDYNDTAMCDAIAYAKASGVAVFASAGNYDTTVPSYPANCEEAVSIAATNHKDERAIPFCWGGGSNYGDKIYLSAPGDNIYGYGTTPGAYSGYYCGTSQASPHVAGTAALLLSIDPSLSVDEIKSLLADGAEDLVGRPYEDTEGWDPYHGWGRLNAFNSLKLLLKRNAGTVTTVLDTGTIETGTSTTSTTTAATTDTGTPSDSDSDTASLDLPEDTAETCGCQNVPDAPKSAFLWFMALAVYFRARRPSFGN